MVTSRVDCDRSTDAWALYHTGDSACLCAKVRGSCRKSWVRAGQGKARAEVRDLPFFTVQTVAGHNITERAL